MSEPNWTSLALYLAECNEFTLGRMEDIEDIPAIDEAVTAGIASLRRTFDLDLDDPRVAHALIVGFAVAYRHGQVLAQDEGLDHPIVVEFLRRHSKASGNIGLVVRQIATNLGVPLARFSE